MKCISDPREMIPYLTDESRKSGTAQGVFLPGSSEEISCLLKTHPRIPITLQGARTGVTAGAVPQGGLVCNLSSMDQIVSLPESPVLPAVVQPGVLLCQLQERLSRRGLFFPPDPTESTASIGGMISCNSSGARSFRYGATRNHILGLQLVLSDGDSLTIHRGQYHARAGRFQLQTDSGRTISGVLPDISMPRVRKHTAGYYLRPDMDLLDLFIGSEGTLGIATRIRLSPESLPRHRWACMTFFETEEAALRLICLLRESCGSLPAGLDALEFFGEDTLTMLRQMQISGTALPDQPPVPSGCAVYTEFSSEDRSCLEALCRKLDLMIRRAGSDPRRTWFAFHGPDMQKFKDFRHMAPVCVNERISQIKKRFPMVTKLGTDMSVPDHCLTQVFAMYRRDLAQEGLSSSIFGHIGDNHLHVNIIPQNEEEYERGRQLVSRWADEVVRMGGSVSAEHGIGKLKTRLLRKLYSEQDLHAMLELKRLFDPQMRLNPGNIFGALS